MIPKSNRLRNVNVALDIIKRYAFDKEHKELLGVGILFHLWRSNGVIWNVTYQNLMEWLHVGKAKAKRLMRQMQEDELFCVNGTRISVRSFRDKTQKRTRKGRRYSGATCALFKADREYTLKDIYNIINDILLLARIKATAGLTIYPIENYVQSRSYLTCRQLAKSIGMGRSSVSRLTKRLKENGTIIKDPAVIYTVINWEHKEVIESVLHQLGYTTVSFTRGSDAWIMIPCGYAIKDPLASRTIRHKIYGYRSKRTQVALQPNTLAEMYPTIPQFNE